MTLRQWFVLSVTGIVSACTWQPPQTYPAPAPVSIPASFGRVWDAVVDHFAEHNVPIKTIERASGIIATDAMAVPLSLSTQYADCGSDALIGPYTADLASYSIRVQGDSSATTVRVTMSITSRGPAGTCSSKGQYEKELVADIQHRTARR
jgi:hypothetical protein